MSVELERLCVVVGVAGFFLGLPRFFGSTSELVGTSGTIAAIDLRTRNGFVEVAMVRDVLNSNGITGTAGTEACAIAADLSDGSDREALTVRSILFICLSCLQNQREDSSNAIKIRIVNGQRSTAATVKFSFSRKFGCTNNEDATGI